MDKPNIQQLMQSVNSSTAQFKVFLSYSHQDELSVNELRKDLKLLERNGLVQTWYDRALGAGELWEPRILQELREADAIICQLSRDFLASDFCVLTELETAIHRKEKGEAELIAYVLKDCGWRKIPKLKQFQILPRDAKPIDEWPTVDKYWRAVADGIEKALINLQLKRKREHPELRFKNFM